MRWEEAIQANSIPTEWVTHTLEIIASQRFPNMSESPEPHVRFPSLRVWYLEEESPKHLTLEAVGLSEGAP